MSGFAIIVAADEQRGIGKDNTLPWRLPGDMAFYKRTTISAPENKQNALIMGRRTFESIPKKFRPLPQRLNIVLTRDGSYVPEGGALRASSLDEALALVAARDDVGQTFVIGGGQLFDEALQRHDCERIIITRVHATFDCDTFLVPFEQAFELKHSDGPHQDEAASYTFETYERRS